MGLCLTGQQGRLQLQRKELAKPREFRGREEVKALPWTLSSFPGNCTSPKTAEEMERKKEEKEKGREEKDYKATKVGRRTKRQLFPEFLRAKINALRLWWH